MCSAEKGSGHEGKQKANRQCVETVTTRACIVRSSFCILRRMETEITVSTVTVKEGC